MESLLFGIVRTVRLSFASCGPVRFGARLGSSKHSERALGKTGGTQGGREKRLLPGFSGPGMGDWERELSREAKEEAARRC